MEIRGTQISGNVLSYLKNLPDGSLRIGDIKGSVNVGDRVYRVTKKSLLAEAEASYADDFVRKIPVEMQFVAALGEFPRLLIRELGMKDWQEVVGDKVTEQAVNTPLDEARVRKQLAKLGDTVWEVSDLSLRLDDNISLPVSVINHMRREAAARVQDVKCKAARMNRVSLTVEELEDIYAVESLSEKQRKKIGSQHSIDDVVHFYSDASQELENILQKMIREKMQKNHSVRFCMPLEIYMNDEKRDFWDRKIAEYAGGAGVRMVSEIGECIVVTPYILNISKGELDAYIEENFYDICEKVRDSGILVGNLGWIRRFQFAGIKVYGDYGLNVYNLQSQCAFEEMDVEILQWSHEAEASFFENMPLMVTEHPISVGRIKDRKRKEHIVVKNVLGDKYLIFER